MKLIALALLFALAPPVPTVSGKWSGSFQVSGSDGQVAQLFILAQNGTKLTGTGGPDASERYPIANGQVNGPHVTFDLTNAFARFFYDLTDSGTQLKGKLTIKSINSTRTAEVTLTKSD